MSTRDTWWPVVIVVSAVAAGAAFVAGVGAPVQPAAAFWFLLVCPGMAWIRLVWVASPLVELALALALSLALDTLVAEALVLAGRWSAAWALGVLIALSLVGAALQVARVSARRARARGAA
ncbi:MAG TPA: hypothetical protein VFW96_20290 [Thermomicrobiales bacterium]|nr:hypothetical protein [Thermomicrobiales bacterium]